MTHKKKEETICKLCGTKQRSKTKRCIICNIPVGKKCRRYKLCLNCYVNLNTEDRKTLKFLTAMMWATPLYALFLLIYGIQRYITFLIIIETIYLLLYLYILKLIHKKPQPHISIMWWKKINSNLYKSLTKENNTFTYMDLLRKEEEEKRRIERIEKLKEWDNLLNKIKEEEEKKWKEQPTEHEKESHNT